MVEPIQRHQCVLVCQNRTCKKQGALSVLQAFRAIEPTGWEIVASACLGQCGNGPMVRVLPDDNWYWRVRASEVPAIVDRHLLHDQPISKMLYPGVHGEF